VKRGFVMNQKMGLRRYSLRASWSACRWNILVASHHTAVAAHRINRRHGIWNEWCSPFSCGWEDVVSGRRGGQNTQTDAPTWEARFAPSQRQRVGSSAYSTIETLEIRSRPATRAADRRFGVTFLRGDQRTRAWRSLRAKRTTFRELKTWI
jgi:hypothetical protein